MDLHEALYTTRAMRRVKTDPIPEDVQARILDAAIRAPSGGNSQGWKFLVVDDADVKAKLAPIYQKCMAELWAGHYKPLLDQAAANPEAEESKSMMRVQRSAQWLADNFADYPMLLFGFVQFDPSGGSIFPAIWSAQLAARAEGVGSALTSVLAFHQDEVYDILGVPAEEGWIMACCVTFGYPTGRWGVAKRIPVDQVSYRNSWGTELGISIPEPLWPAD